MKYRKKPVTIEAYHYVNEDNYRDAPNWLKKAYENKTAYYKDHELFIKTLEGDHHASKGDFIIQGVNGELYSCKPDIFEKTYEKVKE